MPAAEVAATGQILRPGDVIVTATHDLGGWWIRLRSRLQGRPSLHNHVAMFTHYDSAGVARGVEGRPGGFGWADLTRYLNHPDTITNADQPGRVDSERADAVRIATAMMARPYDWRAILLFAAEVLDRRVVDLIERGREYPDGKPPSHVVCSSALDWIYEELHWASPGGNTKTRFTDPDDWTDFIQHKRWQA